jgi:hypothetical protein
MPINPTLILGGMQLLGGLFGKKSSGPSPADNLVEQARGARVAAERYGFNPMTMMQYGQTGGAMGGGGAPPLASTELLMGGLADIGDVLSGAQAQRVAANKLQTELGQIKLDQLRASAATKIGAGSSPLGRRSVQTFSTSVPSKVELQFGLGPLKVEPKAVSTPLVTANGEVVSVPNGGDIDEVVTGAAIEGIGYLKKRLRPVLPNLDNVSGGQVVDGVFPWMRRTFMPALQFPKTAFTNPSKLDKRALDLWTQIAP